MKTGLLSLFYLNFCSERHQKSLSFKAIPSVSEWANSSLAPLVTQTQDGLQLGKEKQLQNTTNKNYLFLQIKEKTFQSIIFMEEVMHTAENS